jgi:hypothetical protein
LAETRIMPQAFAWEDHETWLWPGRKLGKSLGAARPYRPALAALQVPTRTLVQIRTHAQKYFLKHQMPPTRADDGLGSLNGFGSAVNAMPGFEGLLEGEGDMEGAGAAGGARGDQTLKPVATIRHVALEPLHPGDQLGIVFRQSPTTGECGGERRQQRAGARGLAVRGRRGRRVRHAVFKALPRLGQLLVWSVPFAGRRCIRNPACAHLCLRRSRFTRCVFCFAGAVHVDGFVPLPALSSAASSSSGSAVPGTAAAGGSAASGDAVSQQGEGAAATGGAAGPSGGDASGSGGSQPASALSAPPPSSSSASSSSSAGGGAAAAERYIPGAAEESDLIRVNDVVLGVSSVCVLGMEPATVNRIVAAARAVTPGGLVVLHLCDESIEASLVEEATLQMRSATAHLLNGRPVLDAIHNAVFSQVFAPTAGGAAASGSSGGSIAGGAPAAASADESAMSAGGAMKQEEGDAAAAAAAPPSMLRHDGGGLHNVVVSVGGAMHTD